MKNRAAFCLALLLTGCFQSPNVIEIAKIDTLNAEHWYQFDINHDKRNQMQDIRISFTQEAASSPQNQQAYFDLIAVDHQGSEYAFQAQGELTSMVFTNEQNIDLTEKQIKQIKLKANISAQDLVLTWVSF